MYLIDGHSQAYRAFYAIRSLSTSKGFPTNAIYGFTAMLLKLLKEQEPTHIVVAFDHPTPSFRVRLDPQYKATRQKMPGDLIQQLPSIKEIVQAYGIALVEQEGFEADDLIGTLSERARLHNLQTVIVASDKDFFQLIENPSVAMLDPRSGTWIHEEEVIEKMGLKPSQVRDFLALCGDTSDNIPGLPGVGPATAKKLLKQFESVEGLGEKLNELYPESLRQSLVTHQSLLQKNLELSTIRRDVPLPLSLEATQRQPPNFSALQALFVHFEFKKLFSELPPSPLPSPALPTLICLSSEEALRTVLIQTPKEKDLISFLYDSGISSQGQKKSGAGREEKGQNWIPAFAGMTSLTHGGSSTEPCGGGPPPQRGRETTDLPNPLSATAALQPQGEREPHEKFPCPLLFYYLGGDTVYQVEGKILQGVVGKERNIAPVSLWSYDLKSQCHTSPTLLAFLPPGPIYDVLVVDYLLRPNASERNLEALAFHYLQENISSLLSSNAGNPVQRLSILHRVAQKQREQMTPELQKAYQNMEYPLIRVLYEMEKTGMSINGEKIHSLKQFFYTRLSTCESKIYTLAGERFSIHSPKQLRTLLYEKLKLPPGKKTKTGYSTDQEELERLGFLHPLPNHLLEYRQLSKLVSTYLEPLPALVHPATGRLHTTYHQAATATGRLSSSHPNLQNIPIRTEEGRKIRELFVATPGYTLLSLDYSQIELRILAHFSEDPILLQAFLENQDIHAHVAAQLFNLPLEGVDGAKRRIAKTINFGVIYGLSAHGLARQLGLGHAEAQAYIDNFFKKYQGVRTFIDQTVETARQQGFIRTLMGRLRDIPELTSSNATLRSQGERMAVNTLIQGSAADIMKLAMIQVHQALTQDFTPSPQPFPTQGGGSTDNRYSSLNTPRLLLQIHDELILEAPLDQAEHTAQTCRTIMEKAVSLKVPLQVNGCAGPHWGALEH